MTGEELRRALRPLIERSRAMIGRCVLAAIRDDGPLQVVQMKLLGFTEDDVERFGEWGLISHPPVGSEGVFAYLGESAAHPVVLGVEHADHRPKDSDPGESGLYTTDGVTRIRVRPDGTIEIRAQSTIRIESDADIELTAGGNVSLGAVGSVAVDGDIQIEGRDWLDHQHSGVESGGGTSGGVL